MLINLSAQLSFKIFSIFITALLSPGNSIFSPVSLYFTINAPFLLFLLKMKKNKIQKKRLSLGEWLFWDMLFFSPSSTSTLWVKEKGRARKSLMVKLRRGSRSENRINVVLYRRSLFFSSSYFSYKREDYPVWKQSPVSNNILSTLYSPSKRLLVLL